MSNVSDFPRTPMEILELTIEDAKDADEIEKVLAHAFGNRGDFDQYLVSLAIYLIAQLRRRVTALEERLEQKEG